MNNGFEEPAWRTSSYSQGNSNCLETVPVPRETGQVIGAVALRDSKSPGTTMSITPEAFGALIADIKNGDYDLR